MTLLVLVLFGTITAVRGNDDFQDVFNGQDLTGWKGKPDLWRVEEGAIVGETVKGKPIPANTFLVWQGGELGDFEFTAQVRFRGNNSGVQYRSVKHDGHDLVLCGYQFDLHPRQDYYGMLFGEKYADRKIIATRGQKVVIDSVGKKHVLGKVGDDAELTDWAWNEIRIVAFGNRLIHEVNGVTAVDVTDDHPTARPTGLLGLQLHSGAPMRAEFKALKLRRLSKEQGQHVLQQFAGTKQAPAAPVELIETNGIPGLVQNLSVAKGFQVELVHKVPRDKQGSWVSLALDGQGRLLVSDQGGKGIYRITPGADANATKVEKASNLSGSQGMGWHKGALYLSPSQNGLYRVTDSNGDDQLDRAELLAPLLGQGEHGIHAVFDAEDGTHLYVVAGKVFREPAAQARITGAIALARVGTQQHREPLVRSLLELDVENLPRMQQLGLLRAFALAFERLGRPDDEQRTGVIGKLDPLFPSSDTDLNTELLRLLVYLDAPSAVTKGIALLAGGGEETRSDLKHLSAHESKELEQLIKSLPPSTRIGYAFILRTATAGWTSELRREYFSFLNQAAKASGGSSYPGYLTNIRDEALSFCSDDQRRSLAKLTGRNFNPVPDFPIHPPKGPGRQWSLEDALAVAGDQQLSGANIQNGRSLFYATQCGACHRFNGLGGGVGPDLTSVPLKFDTRYLIEAIINPSKDISDQYRGSTVVLDDGRVLSGLVVAEDEETLRVYPPDPKSTGVLVKKVDVATDARQRRGGGESPRPT